MNNRSVEIFIGSSSEAGKIDKEIRSLISRLGASVVNWRNISNSGDFLLDNLLDLTSQVDGAILIASADDTLKKRGETSSIPRDNIILEIGLFLSQLGRRRTCIILVPNKDKVYPSLPSDLDGLTCLKYRPDSFSELEHNLEKLIKDIQLHQSKYSLIRGFIKRVRPVIMNIPKHWLNEIQNYVINPIFEAVDSVEEGELLLTTSEYYNCLYREMEQSNEDYEILAVSTMVSEIWTDDIEQKIYLRKNIEASKRNVAIKRLYIKNKEEWPSLNLILSYQIKAGIDVKITTREHLSNVINLEDMAIFIDKNSDYVRVYVIQYDLFNPKRIKKALLITDPKKQNKLIESFHIAWPRILDYSPKLLAINLSKANLLDQKAPGNMMQTYLLDHLVVSCEEAAQSKGIPIKNELKSIILQTSNGFICVHITGDKSISLKKAKQLLGVEEAFIAPPGLLKTINLSPGTISAVLEPTWSMKQIILKDILKLRFISTNNGTLTGYYKFDPRILQSAPEFNLVSTDEICEE
ncbi:MAG: hypothetical protein GY839_05895 [candidate division Zixibacteria bacterium]|nr:hypothetical protein [candidate division Zixibacteria bacterium]